LQAVRARRRPVQSMIALFPVKLHDFM